MPILRRTYELCKKLGIVDDVFKSANLLGKTALDVAADAGAIRVVTFLSPIVPASITAPPPVRTPGDAGREKGPNSKSATPTPSSSDVGLQSSEETLASSIFGGLGTLRG